MASLYDPADLLTPRQQDIVRLSYAGYSFDEIADELGISSNTLRWHTTLVRRVYPQFRCGWTPQQVRLTRVERSVMHLVADGLSNLLISERLNISINTVNVYVSQLYRKTRTKNRVELTRTALVIGNRVQIGESEATYA